MPDWDALAARFGRGRVTVSDGRLRADEAVVDAAHSLGDDAAAALIEALAALAEALAGRPRLGQRSAPARAYLLRPDGWWGRVLAGAGLADVGRHWRGAPGAVSLDRERLAFGPPVNGWVTPYEPGELVAEAAWLPLDALPTAEADAIDALLRLSALAAAARPPAGPGADPEPGAVH